MQKLHPSGVELFSAEKQKLFSVSALFPLFPLYKPYNGVYNLPVVFKREEKETG